MKRGLAAAVAGWLAFSGCNVAEEPAVVPESDVTDAVTEEAEISAFSRSYVTIRRDFRKCISPLCGGYWVRDVNRKAPTERYVSALDFELAAFSESDIAVALEAGEGELLLRGKLSEKEPTYETRKLIVYEAYRGLPGVKVAAGDLYYRAMRRDPEILCITAPCNNDIAYKLNSTQETDFTSYSVEDAALPLVDQTWLVREVQDRNAIVTARFSPGAELPGGPERVLHASQVFLRIPYGSAPCPLVKPVACSAGEVHAYERNADRCVLPTSCVTPGMCLMGIPSCAEGYVLQSWTSAPHACPAYSCEPAFALAQ
jgi:hypothetical protein